RKLALRDGVGREARDVDGLERRRQHLEQKRIAGIALAYPRDVGARHEQRKVPRGFGRDRVRRKVEQRRELADVADRVAELALPRRAGGHRNGGWIVSHAVRSEGRGGIIRRRHSRNGGRRAAAERRSRPARSADRASEAQTRRAAAIIFRASGDSANQTQSSKSFNGKL